MNETQDQQLKEFQEENQPKIVQIKEKPPKPQTIDLNDYVHKKIAAREVYNNVKKTKILALISTISIFIVLISSVLGIIVASITALIFSGINGYYLWKSQTTMKYLEEKYKL